MVVGIRLSLKPVASGEEPEAVQVNKVPETFEVSVTPVARLLHWVLEGGLLVKVGVG